MELSDDVGRRITKAIRKGRVNNVIEIIESYGLSHLPEWRDGYDLLYYALHHKQTDIAKLLLNSGCRLTVDHTITRHPLHLAIKNNDIEVIKLILDRNINDVKAKNRHGFTPLYYGIRNGSLDVIELLIQHGASVNEDCADGRSPLFTAVALGDIKVAEYLLEHNASIDSVCNEAKGHTPLHIAVNKNNEEMVTLLLNRGADVNTKGSCGKTPLHIATLNKNINILTKLFDNGADIDSAEIKRGYTALHLACAKGCEFEEIVELLLKRGANVNAKDEFTKYNPLHVAIQKCSTSIVKLLLQNGAKVDEQDKNGNTALYFAVKVNEPIIIEEVLKFCPDKNNESNQKAFKAIVLNQNPSVKKLTQAFLDYGFTVNPKEEKDLAKLFHGFVRNGCLKIVKDLLDNGVEVDIFESQRNTPLLSAVKYKQKEVAELLISHGADVNAKNEYGQTPLLSAIHNGNVETFKILLRNNAEIKKDDPQLLKSAVESSKCREIVEILLNEGVDVNAREKNDDNDGMMALHYINNQDCNHVDDDLKIELYELLLNNGADINAKYYDGFTVLYDAANKGCAKIVEFLLKRNANVNSKVLMKLYEDYDNCDDNYSDDECDGVLESFESTPLAVATIKGRKDVVKLLLENGADIDSTYDYGKTVLHLAAERGHWEIAKNLLDFGADVNATAIKGATPFWLAHRNNRAKVMDVLLEYGADVNISTNSMYNLYEVDSDGLDSDESDFYGYQIDSDEEIEGFESDEYDSDGFEIDNSDSDESDPFFRYNERNNHLVAMKVANFYFSAENLKVYEKLQELVKKNKGENKLMNYERKCEEELTIMKTEKVADLSISFYDILMKSTQTVAVYARNRNVVQVLSGDDDLQKKFPIYAVLIKRQFRAGVERNRLLDQSEQVINFFFNNKLKLPSVCVDIILSYFDNKELKILIDALKITCA